MPIADAAPPQVVRRVGREKTSAGVQDALRIVAGVDTRPLEARTAGAPSAADAASGEARDPRAEASTRTDRLGTTEQPRSFQDIASRLRPDLYRYAFWLSRDPSLADDLVQEALMRGWKSLHSLKDDRAAKQWLLTIVRREHARLYERKRLETVDIDEIASVEEALVTAPVDPDVAKLRHAIADLEPEYREPLVLQVLLGHGTGEIAQLMGINQGAVLTRLFRARKKLAAVLVENSPSQ
jgi:RNA polymerase sigma-70 factor, ECF subfamily